MSRMSARTPARYAKNSQWLLLVLAAMSARAADTYRLDAGNTRVSFAVQHLGIQWMSAHFSDINGRFVVDPGTVRRVDVTVGIASLECNEPRWNERLRSSEWLDAERYPRMSFHSSRIELSEGHGVAHGELTLHGVTHPIELTVSQLQCASAGQCQFAAHGRIRRSEYGLPHGFWSGGDQVEIAISGTLGGPLSSTLGSTFTGRLGGAPELAGRAIKDASARQN